MGARTWIHSTVVALAADPRLTDYELLLENMTALRDGRPAEVPIYDFKQSKRVGFSRVEVPTSRVVIIEGIYALSARIRCARQRLHAFLSALCRRRTVGQVFNG